LLKIQQAKKEEGKAHKNNQEGKAYKNNQDPTSTTTTTASAGNTKIFTQGS